MNSLILFFVSVLGLSQTHKVELKNMKFYPAQIEIKVGDTVEWENKEALIHTVTSGNSPKPDYKFSSKVLRKGEVFKFTFTEPGEYPYFCQPHMAMMKGKVIVK